MMGRKFGFSFSAKRALGISAARGRIARATGIPTTRSGRQRKIGRLVGSPFLLLFSGRRRPPRAAAAMGSGACPACGVRFNVRASSIGTLKRCSACGHKFVLERKRSSALGCLLMIGLCIAGFYFVRGRVGADGPSPLTRGRGLKLGNVDPPRHHVASPLTVEPSSHRPNPEYVKLQAEVDRLKSVLDKARASGGRYEKLDASAAWNKARLRLEKMTPFSE